LSFYSSPFHDEYCIKKEYLLVIRIGDSYLHTIGYSYLTIYTSICFKKISLFPILTVNKELLISFLIFSYLKSNSFLIAS